jgi:hypothetical protein
VSNSLAYLASLIVLFRPYPQPPPPPSPYFYTHQPSIYLRLINHVISFLLRCSSHTWIRSSTALPDA